MTDEIKLLEAIKDTLQVGVQAIVGQIGESSARLEAKLGARIDETNARLNENTARLEVNLGVRIDETNSWLGSIETRVGNTERQLDQTNHKLETIVGVVSEADRKLDNIVGMFSEANRSLSARGDIVDQRITALEHRVDKIEEAS